MSNQDNILNLLTMILEQMMHNYQGLQNQLVQQDWKLSDAIRQLTQDNETFKQEVRFEFQNLRSPGNHPSSSSRSASPVLSSPSVPSSFLVSQNTLIPHFLASSNTTSHQDFQNQMMTMLNNTFS